METVIRMTVEPFFINLFNKISDLDKKINTLDTKITKIEHELIIIGNKIDNKVHSNESGISKYPK
jgi:hypothetical protein